MPLKGDFSKLRGLQAALKRLEQVPSRLATPASQELTKLLKREYAEGADPYGKTWAKLATGGASHLDKTGNMKAGTLARPLPGRGIALVLPTPGNFHQFGTKKMPARPVLPNKGMPAEWNQALNKLASAEVKKALK